MHSPSFRSTYLAGVMLLSALVLAGCSQAPTRTAPVPVAQVSSAPMALARVANLDSRTMPFPPREPADRAVYAKIDDNPIKRAAEQPVSTFSIDVDTGAYANVRRFLNSGRLPPKDAVRAEELINYFPYSYPLPEQAIRPFSLHTEVAPTPWNKNTHLLKIGIKGMDIAKATLPPANLVFLIDVSGSMYPPERLPLLKTAFKLFTKELRSQDKVSIVVYAGRTAVALPPTSGADKAAIVAALDQLTAGGSTAGASGIKLAYQMAEQAFIPGGINRILLATDGDFNVGITHFETLKGFVEEKRKSGIALSTLGVGVDNYNERLMEQLADAGNGHYSYLDTISEAQKVLVDEFTSTLATIAKDVKIQLEFNPHAVQEYRLIGYENRLLQREDFKNDKVDAGDIGAGHTVTALYEITLLGKPPMIEPLRYKAARKTPGKTAKDGELAFLRVRYKLPDEASSRLIEQPIPRSSIHGEWPSASVDFRFAAAVAAFSQELRGGKHLDNFGYDDIAQLAAGARGEDRFGYRGEFLRLVNLAKSLSTPERKRDNQP